MYVIPAEFKTFEVTATQQDVDQNWTYLQARKVQYMGYMEPQPPLDGGTPLMPTPFAYRDSNWECKGCQYLTLCDAEAATIQTAEAQHVMATEEENARFP
jgi:hypothetical protein